MGIEQKQLKPINYFMKDPEKDFGCLI